MRRLERWLHQHIFKVGWLLTKRSQTTTILYYTFFLPGVALHELILWLVAGILNVRAERAFAWPEATAIAELKLNFIRLSKDAGRVKIAIISLSPLLGGLAVIWLISNNILNLNLVIAVGRAGTFDDFTSAARLLLATPDIWLWVYLMFAVANTMFPSRDSLRGWRPALMVLAGVAVVLYVVGIGQQLFLENLALPITEGLNRLALIFVVIIAIDLIVTGVLGTLEAVIERFTGHSATFQNGKLVALTKEDLQRIREQHRAKREKQRPAAKAPRPTRLPAGPPSIYKLALPIPPAPGKEALEPSVIAPPSGKPAYPSPSPAPAVASPGRSGPTMITGTATVKADDELQPDRPLQEAKIELPSNIVKPSMPASHTVFNDEDEAEDQDEDNIDDMLSDLASGQTESEDVDEDEEEERL